MVKQIQPRRLTPKKVSFTTEVYWVGIAGALSEGPFTDGSHAQSHADNLNREYGHHGFEVWTQDITVRRST